ncbi:MAG: hydantoinase/oxoprolinase family protein, partial [Pseudomonadota bacterium]
MFSIDIDVGGTFTDGFFTDGTAFKTAKVLTTPHDVTDGFMDCVRSGSELFDLQLDDFLRRTSVARLSTTIGTNLLVQRNGARVGLLVSTGKEETLYNRDRAKILDDIIDAHMVKGITENVDDDGNCVQVPNPDEVLTAVRELIHDGAQIIVVSFENAWRNPDNEIAVRNIIRNRYPTHYLRSVTVQLGSEILQHSSDHPRTNSAILNAYIHSDMARALFRAEDRIREAGLAKPLLIVHASGGNARVAKTVALNTLHSGPAVAVKGAAVIATTLGLDNVVSADMGGTSFDIGMVVDRQANLDLSPSVDGISIAIPTIHVDSAGIGGGSIAWLDEGQTLKVGPASAGSAPGPAAYRKGGTEPTVTDANVVLGFVDPDNFLGGKMKLDLDAARRVINRRVAKKLNVSVEQAAFDIRRIANQHMGDEIKTRLQANGVIPEETVLLSVGGAGPLHACDVSSAANLKGALALRFGSVFSAFGGSQTNVQHFYRHTFVSPVPASPQSSMTLRAAQSLGIQ